MDENQHKSGLTLSDTQRVDWLRLTRTTGIGPRTFRTLINRFGSATEALEALPICCEAKINRRPFQAGRMLKLKSNWLIGSAFDL